MTAGLAFLFIGGLLKFRYLSSEKEVWDIIEHHVDKNSVVVLDTETTSVNPHEAQLVDIQINGREDDEALNFPAEFAHCLLAFNDAPNTLVFHNFKYDLIVLSRVNGLFQQLASRVRDTMLMSHLVDENRDSHSLNSWVLELTGDTYKDDFWRKHASYLDASVDERLAYSCADIVYTRRLYLHLTARLTQSGVGDSLVQHVHRLASALFRTELEGIAIDVPYLSDIGITLNTQIEEIKPKMKALVELPVEAVELDMWQHELDKRKTPKGKAGVPRPVFSWDSNKQIQALLYGELGLPVQKNEKTRSISVDDASLEKINTHHAIVPLLQKYRGLHKVYGAYIEGTLDRMREGRIYPSFNINGTVTGRISSSNPNMQQLPKDGGIRGIYVPDSGYRFITCDYAQLEVTLAAHFSRDKQLLKIVEEGASQHDITAESLGIPRDLAKTLNFAAQYRCSHYKVAKLLGVTEEEGKRIYDKYWQTYSGLKRLMDTCDRMVDSGKFIVNPFGRIRRFEEKKRSPWDKAYRQAFNALIQGTGADLCSRAFYLVDDALRASGAGKGLFTVHDELVVTVLKERVDEGRALLQSVMKTVGEEIRLTVPLSTDCSEGVERWEK